MPTHVLAVCFTGKRHRQERLMAELRRAELEDVKIIWGFPTPFDAYLQARLPHCRGFRDCPGTWGATMSHYRAMKTAYELGWDNVLIVEDDCRFLKDIERVWRTVGNAPANWDILLLDHFDTVTYQEEPKDGWVHFHKSHSAGCYLVNRRAMGVLIDLYESPVSGKYPNPKMRLADHWTNEKYTGGKLAMYCAVPNLAIQCDCGDSPNCYGVQNKSYQQYGLNLSEYGSY